ncbi:MAG: DUF427 domain-containing protein [Caulobacteraceae bacterium]
MTPDMSQDQSISIRTSTVRARAKFAGHVIADTEDAVILTEEGRDPVIYFPMDDVETAYMGEISGTTYNPRMGTARYLTLIMEGRIAEGAAWTYDDPEPAAEPIRGRLAFDPAQVEVYQIEDAYLGDTLGHQAARAPGS